MDLIIKKTPELSGTATVPSSKSQNVRALLFALLAGGSSIIKNILDSEDTRDTLRVAQALGASMTHQGSQIIVSSSGLPLTTEVSTINSGNSGITTLFAMPLLGYRLNTSQRLIYDCGNQMRARPIHALVDALRNLGLSIEYLDKAGACPIAVTGRLLGGTTQVDGSSSQYLSALLISLPCAEKDSEISVFDLQERPYAFMTLDWLQEQKIDYHHRSDGKTDIFTIPGRQHYRPFQKMLSGDFSSASYLIAAGVLLNGSIELQGLDMQDPQGDKRLIPILQAMGADITVTSHRLIIRGGKHLTGMRIDANDIPDLLPTLAVIATQATGKTLIVNAKHARVKETDRVHSMTQGLIRLGARVEEHADGLSIYPSALTGNTVQGFGDHRTVMALSIAGLLAQGSTRIDQAEAINKTFPQFIELMRSLGARMEVQA